MSVTSTWLGPNRACYMQIAVESAVVVRSTQNYFSVIITGIRRIICENGLRFMRGNVYNFQTPRVNTSPLLPKYYIYSNHSTVTR